jgi:membrane protease YdiL (CAAX protease family)
MSEKTFLQKILRLLLLFIGFNLLGYFVTLFLLNILFNVDGNTLLSIFNNLDTIDNSSTNVLKFMQFVQMFFSLIIPAHLFARSESNNQLVEYFQLNNTSYKNYLTGILLLVCISPLVSYIAELNEQIQLPSFLSSVENYFKQKQIQTEKLSLVFLGNNTGVDLLINIFIVGVLAAIAEELFFRGVLQKIILEKVKNIHMAILICSFLFSALHQEFYSLFPRVLLGMLLGYAYVFSKSIWVPISIHFVNNTAIVLLDSLYKQGISSFNPNENEYFGIIGVFISLILSIPLFWYWNKNKSNGINYNYGEKLD